MRSSLLHICSFSKDVLKSIMLNTLSVIFDLKEYSIWLGNSHPHDSIRLYIFFIKRFKIKCILPLGTSSKFMK